ncbi:hypothetical protein GIB67_021219 [Kingdonia uniflora]|uniref:RNase H type-1 domain-containing protein n=1 Tax=Kingdonia uniflora TaxID=39325 RepID=A0A7J7LFK0_9MAGN|nr:hypothetical protein GIB67_021219 [Kingdonia uniflora]
MPNQAKQHTNLIGTKKEERTKGLKLLYKWLALYQETSGQVFSSEKTITKGSSIWAGVRGALEDVSAHLGWVIGDGKCINLGRDNWCSPLSLKDMINDDVIPWTDLNAKLPNHGEIKINTDGAARGNPGKGSIGCIFRDSEGEILGSFSQGLGLVSNYTAECKAIIKGVDLAASNGWLIAWVESDSKVAVEAFHSDNIPWV